MKPGLRKRLRLQSRGVDGMLKTIKSIAKAVVSPTLDATGMYRRRIDRVSAQPGAWTIAMYHRVIDDARRDPFQLGMCVMQRRFEQQVRFLSKHFHIITAGDAVRRLAAGEPLPPRALSITFDDGYRDTLTHALPVLQKLGVPFSVYVPTESMGTDRMLWWDRVILALAATRRTEFDLQEVGLSANSQVLSLGSSLTDDPAETVLNLLWKLDKTSCDRSVDLIEQHLAPIPRPHLKVERLAPDEIITLRRAGVEIGAHSVSHPNLELAGDELIRQELEDSRRSLESLLQEPVTGLAYPGGHVGPAALRIAAELRFAYALGTGVGTNLAPYDMLRLKRIGMPDAELSDFRRAFSQAMARTKPDDQLHF